MADTSGTAPVPRPDVRRVLRSVRAQFPDATRATVRIASGRRSERAGVPVNVLLAAALLLTTGSAAYALSLPDDRGRYTEFGVLTRDDSGELVADEYPRELDRGASTHLVLSIGNHERVGSTYTVVVQLQRVSFDDDGRVAAVRESRTLSREGVTVGPGMTRRVPYDLSPTMVGEDLRVSFLLYRGSPPPDPDAGNAYRDLHLWVNVSSGGGAETVDDPG